MTAGSYGKKIFSFLRNHQTVFQSSYTILHPYQKWMSSCCSISLQAVGGISVSDFGHSNKCVVVPSCFKFHSLDDIICLFDHMLFTICVSSLVRYLSKSLAHFLTGLFAFLSWSFRSSLCVSENNLLSDIYMQIFFLSWSSVFQQCLRRAVFYFNAVQLY